MQALFTFPLTPFKEEGGRSDVNINQGNFSFRRKLLPRVVKYAKGGADEFVQVLLLCTV